MRRPDWIEVVAVGLAIFVSLGVGYFFGYSMLAIAGMQ